MSATVRLPAAVENEEEAGIIGAALERPSMIGDLAAIVAPEHFTDERRTVWAAILALYARATPIDERLIAAVLGDVDAAGRSWLLMLFDYRQASAIPEAALALADRVRERAERRRLSRVFGDLSVRAQTEDPEAVTAAALEALDGPSIGRGRRFTDGASWILDGTEDVEAVWGHGDAVLWAQGEPMMVVGPDGTGKTTLAVNLALGLVGLLPSVLGFPVRPVDRVLYVAADRPRQIRRRFAQLVTEAERADLAERLAVHVGPLPFDVLREPRALSAFARQAGASVLILDSLGALVPGLAKDEVGSGVRIALDHVIDRDIDVLATHHNRKAGADNKEPRKLEDVYGSRWLTAGCGSVLSLWGDPGAPVVAFRHLKQPAAEVGPFRVEIAADGWLNVQHGSDLSALLATAGGLTARDTARQLYERDAPTKGDVERARRALEREHRAGRAVMLNPERPHQEPARYGAVAPQAWLEGVG